jgi:hypothetical protein
VERVAITLKTTKSFYFLAGLSAFLLVFAQIAFAGTSDNVTGFAWIDNDGGGWVSFNATNCSPGCNAATCATSGATGCPASGTFANYGVNIGTGGKITGQAWSENLGWISFDPSVNGTCPDGTGCQASVDASGKVTGWARAIAGCQGNGVNGTGNYWDGSKCTSTQAGDATGGWDGWIKLAGTTIDGHAYGWTVDPSGYFHGYAFGSTNSGVAAEGVMGWISANCLEGHSNGTTLSSVCSTSDYKVRTTYSFGPVAKIGCGGICLGGECDSNPEWQAYQPIGCTACAFSVNSVDGTNLSTGNINCTYWKLTDTTSGAVAWQSNLASSTFPVGVQPGHYSLSLTLSDQPYNSVTNPYCAASNTSQASHLIWIKGEAQAKFKCSFDDPAAMAAMVPPQLPNWQDCTSPNNAFSKKVVKGETIYVKDSGSQYSEGSSAINSWNWNFTVDGASTNAVTNSISGWTSFTTGVNNAINLKVIDKYAGTGGNRSGCASTSFTAKKVFKWEEVSPVSMVWQYLTAAISKAFTSK